MAEAEYPDDLKELLGAGRITKETADDAMALARVAFDGPAVFASRFYLSGHQDVVRLSFADHDGIGTPPQFRAAIAMSTMNARELVTILTQFLDDRLAKQMVEFAERNAVSGEPDGQQ